MRNACVLIYLFMLFMGDWLWMLILCLEYLSLCAAVSILQPDFKNVSTNVDERVVLDVKDVSLAMPVAPRQGPGVGQGAEVYLWVHLGHYSWSSGSFIYAGNASLVACSPHLR